MMYNPVVNQAFGFTTADSVRYGSTATGNACLVASQVLKANQGTRFIQITSNDGWDMHQNIYQRNQPDPWPTTRARFWTTRFRRCWAI